MVILAVACFQFRSRITLTIHTAVSYPSLIHHYLIYSIFSYQQSTHLLLSVVGARFFVFPLVSMDRVEFVFDAFMLQSSFVVVEKFFRHFYTPLSPKWRSETFASTTVIVIVAVVVRRTFYIRHSALGPRTDAARKLVRSVRIQFSVDQFSQHRFGQSTDQ